MAISQTYYRPTFVGRFTWRTRAEAIGNIRTALFENCSPLARRILEIERGQLTDKAEIEKVRDEVYRLDCRKMKGWGIGLVFNPRCQVLDHTLSGVLIASFPLLKLNRFGFNLMWDHLTYHEACEAVRYRIFKHRPDIAALARNPSAQEQLKEALYALHGGDFFDFGLGTLTRGKGVKHFHGPQTAAEIMIRVFPDLKLDRFWFRGRTFKDIFEAQTAVRKFFFKKYPRLGRDYAAAKERISAGQRLPPDLIPRMQKTILQVHFDEFQDPKLRHFLNPKYFPGFQGSYRRILMRSFPLLELKEPDFQHTLRWRTQGEAAENVRRAVFSHRPQLKPEYEELVALRASGEKNHDYLAGRIGYRLMGISRAQLEEWGVNLGSHGGAVRYFQGSKTRAFEVAFPAVGYGKLRTDYRTNKYSLSRILVVLQCLDLFAKIASNPEKASADDRKLLEKLTSLEFKAILNSYYHRIPSLQHLRILHVHAVLASRLLKQMDKT